MARPTDGCRSPRQKHKGRVEHLEDAGFFRNHGATRETAGESAGEARGRLRRLLAWRVHYVRDAMGASSNRIHRRLHFTIALFTVTVCAWKASGKTPTR